MGVTQSQREVHRTPDPFTRRRSYLSSLPSLSFGRRSIGVLARSVGISGRTVGPGDGIPASVVSHFDATQDDRDTGTVSTVPDLLGFEDLSNGTYFELVSDGINGKRSYQLNGSDTYLEYDITDDPISPPHTIIVVLESVSSSRQVIFSRGSEGAFDGNGGLDIRAGSSTGEEVYHDYGDGSDIEMGFDVDPTNTPSIAVGEITDSGGSWHWIMDTETIDTGTGDGSDFGRDVITWGRDTRSKRYFDGYIGEIAKCTSGYNSRLQDWVNNTLVSKWDI